MPVAAALLANLSGLLRAPAAQVVVMLEVAKIPKLKEEEAPGFCACGALSHLNGSAELKVGSPT